MSGGIGGPPTSGDYAHAAVGDIRVLVGALEKEVKRLTELTDLQTKLIFTLASVLRKGLSSGCAEARAITDQMQELRGSIQEHLRAEAALQRKLQEMRDRDPMEAMKDAFAGIQDVED